MDARTIVADRGDAGLRLDLVLRRHLHDVTRATRTRIQRWIGDGHLLVNGAAVTRSAARAALGDVLRFTCPGLPRAQAQPEELPLTVIYEDAELLAIAKPPGVVVHPAFKHPSGTTMNALLWHGRQWPAGHRPSLVGRLDKGTSGIVLVAKTAAIHAALQQTLREPTSHKEYLAVVYGRPGRARGSIDLKLARHPSDRRRVVVAADGRASLTHFERLASVAAPVCLSLLRCRLITGRMHQIRVHLAARGWPIVGDQTYGPPMAGVADPEMRDLLSRFDRQALHASRLLFTHPVTRARLSIQAPLPRDFSTLLDVSGLTAHAGDDGPAGDRASAS